MHHPSSHAVTATLALSTLVLLAAMSAPALAQDRSNIYGCGIVWGNWLGLPTAQAKEWDRRSMDKIVEMGGTNCPVNFAWIDIERQRGVYNWDYVDHQVAEARARGLELFAYTGLTPDWALPPGILQQYGSGAGYRFPPDPQYIADFENFFRTLATRYRGKVKYYEFWNEPNGCSWINDGCSNGHMAHTYTPWLIRWYNAMKEGDPDCVLAVGGLDYNSGVTNGWQYIEDIYASGGGDYFDAVAIHPYGNPLHWKAIEDTYAVLVRHGHGHKRLWLNEYGWNTANETQKAADLIAVLNELKKPQFFMVAMANYLVITDLPGTPDSGHDYGLCSRNMNTLTITPRASWTAFRDLDKTLIQGAYFTADRTAGPQPFNVQFRDHSQVTGATAWLWEFGDGQTSTQQNPQHLYTQPGLYTVRLTVTGPGGSYPFQRDNYIQVDAVQQYTEIRNPSFENDGGSLAGWEIHVSAADGPDNPPLASGNYGITAPHGSRWGGKITSWIQQDFYMGQVIEVINPHPAASTANYELSAHVQLHARSGPSSPQPLGVRQVWQIGWNNDGSKPADMMTCDNYTTIANLNGNYTANNATAFVPLLRSGGLNVPNLRGVALRVRLYTDNPYQWAYMNFDNVSFSVAAVVPAIPGDFDADGDVDMVDTLAFTACATGPNVGPVAAHCAAVDFDGDEDVDQSDFGVFQACLSGSGQPADPNCANPSP